MNVRTFLCVIAALSTTSWHPLLAGQQTSAAPQCRPAGPLARVAELPEASGVAASRRVPGRFWAHNDSGQPVVLALNEHGAVTGQIRLTGAAVEDWEAIAVGPCEAGSCLYLADIGDNDAARKRITIYRVPEPDAATGTVAVKDVFHATYPDGAQDAEALLVSPQRDLFIVTKGRTGPVALYRFPREMQSGATVALERVGRPRAPGKLGPGDRITDGAMSPNGKWVALRTNGALLFYDSADFTAAKWQEASRLNLAQLKEPQGEGVTFDANNRLYLVGEGGGKSQPGTFAHLTCDSE